MSNTLSHREGGECLNTWSVTDSRTGARVESAVKRFPGMHMHEVLGSMHNTAGKKDTKSVDLRALRSCWDTAVGKKDQYWSSANVLCFTKSNGKSLSVLSINMQNW